MLLERDNNFPEHRVLANEMKALRRIADTQSSDLVDTGNPLITH